MTESVPDGPTDPRAPAMREESTTIVTPGYGAGPPEAGFGSPAVPPPPPLPPPPPAGPPESPVTEPGGRVYAAGEGRYGPVADTAAPEPGAGRGSTTIADDVVERVIERIVGLTADEVAGVHGLHTGTDAEQAVTVRLDGFEATIDIAIRVEFGHAVHEVVERVRSNVVSQSERLLGLSVVEVNVLVADVMFDADGTPPDGNSPEE